MANHVYKSVEITGSSPDGVREAIDGAIAKASQTVRNLDWFEVSTIRGYITNGEVAHFQVQMKVGFRIEERDDE
jgi:flavin-binding protein dodecin